MLVHIYLSDVKKRYEKFCDNYSRNRGESLGWREYVSKITKFIEKGIVQSENLEQDQRKLSYEWLRLKDGQ